MPRKIMVLSSADGRNVTPRSFSGIKLQPIDWAFWEHPTLWPLHVVFILCELGNMQIFQYAPFPCKKIRTMIFFSCAPLKSPCIAQFTWSSNHTDQMYCGNHVPCVVDGPPVHMSEENEWFCWLVLFPLCLIFLPTGISKGVIRQGLEGVMPERPAPSTYAAGRPNDGWQ